MLNALLAVQTSRPLCHHKWVSGSGQSQCSACQQAFGFTRKMHNCFCCWNCSASNRSKNGSHISNSIIKSFQSGFTFLEKIEPSAFYNTCPNSNGAFFLQNCRRQSEEDQWPSESRSFRCYVLRRKFRKHQVEAWWSENREKVYAKYNVRASTGCRPRHINLISSEESCAANDPHGHNRGFVKNLLFCPPQFWDPESRSTVSFPAVNDSKLAGNTLVSSSSDTPLKAWNCLSEGTCTRTLRQHSDYVICLAGAKKLSNTIARRPWRGGFYMGY